MRTLIKRSLTGLLMVGALAFTAVGADAGGVGSAGHGGGSFQAERGFSGGGFQANTGHFVGRIRQQGDGWVGEYYGSGYCSAYWLSVNPSLCQY
jgi:hypothetical protein